MYFKPAELSQRRLGIRYHKIPIISPGLLFVQKAFLLGLFSVVLIFRGAFYGGGGGLGLAIKTA